MAEKAIGPYASGSAPSLPYVQGGGTAAFAAAAGAGLVELSPQGSTNIRIMVVIGATGIANAPGITVKPGAIVTLSGVKPGPAINGANVWIGHSPEELAGGGRLVIPGADVEYPVDNTSEIYVMGNAGDAIQINITMPNVG